MSSQAVSSVPESSKDRQGVLSQISRTFHYRDRHVFIRLCIQYARPHLEFASPARSPWLDADKELEKILKRAVNIVSGLKARAYEEKVKELGLTTLEDRRQATPDSVQSRQWEGHSRKPNLVLTYQPR
jgi:hypothetical protein